MRDHVQVHSPPHRTYNSLTGKAPGALIPDKLRESDDSGHSGLLRKVAKVTILVILSLLRDSVTLLGPISNMGRLGLSTARTGPKIVTKVTELRKSGDSCKSDGITQSGDSGDSGVSWASRSAPGLPGPL